MKLEFPLLCLAEGGFYRINEPQLLGMQDEALRKLAAELPTNMLHAFMLPGGAPAHIQVKAGQIIVWTEIKKVRLATVYTVARDGSVYPLFKHWAENAPEHEASHEWDPGMASMRLFFTSTLLADASNVYQWKNSYLVAKFPKRKEIFRPPLPNIHADARMCMGEYAHHGPCLADVFCHNLSHFGSSKWNADAMSGLTGDGIKALYTFDKTGKQQPPPKEFKWVDLACSPPVNNMNYGELPLIV